MTSTLTVAFLICLVGEVVQSSCSSGRNTHSTQTLYFLSLLPYPDPNPVLQPSWDEGPSVFLAEQLAVEHINKRSDILTGYQIELIQGDGGCDIWSKALVSFTKHVLYSKQQIVGIVGPGCSFASIAVAGLTSRDGIALTTINLALLSSQSQNAYPYSFGVIGSAVVPHLVISLMKHNNWTQVATLYDESRLFHYSTQLQLEQALDNDSQHHIGFSSALYDTHIPLDDLERAGVRIVVLLVGPEFLAKVLCLAYHKGLVYPTYQWFMGIEQTFTGTKFEYEKVHYYCSKDELWEAARGSIDLKLRFIPLNVFQSTDTGLSFYEFLTKYQQKVIEYNHRVNMSISLSYWAPFSYDAVWALALALNNSIELLDHQFNTTLSLYHYGQPQITKVITEMIGSLEFDGVTGKISFDPETGEVKRVVDLLFIEENGTSVSIGNFSNNKLIIMPTSVVHFIPDSFKDKDTDAATVEMMLLVVILIILTLATALALIVIHTLSIIYSKCPSVKASSPKLNHLAFTGCYFLLSTIIVFVVFHNVQTSSFSCALRHAVIFTSSVGGTLVLGVVLAKTWRLYRILVHFTNPGRFISDKVLFGFVIVLASTEILLNALWIGLNPFRVEEGSDGENECAVDHYFVWIAISIVINWIIMLFATWYAAQCQCVPVPRKEFKTTNIISLVYLCATIQLAGFSTFFLSLQTGQDVIAFISFGLICYCSVLSFLLLLFVPPIWPVIKQKYSSRYRKTYRPNLH